MKRKRAALILLLLFAFLPAFGAVCGADWRETKNGTRYLLSAKKYVKSSWKKIDGKWYYFDEKGYLLTGRIQVGGDYFYVKRSTGRLENQKAGWYYYGEKGAMVRNCWQKVDERWFYFGKKGRMKTGQFTVGRKAYYCDKKTGRAEGERVGDYYYNKNGVMVKNRWAGNYYYGGDGKIVYGKFELDGKYYYCSKKGGKVVNRWHKGNFYDEDGVMATKRWIGYGTNRAYVNKNGVITKGNKNPKDPPSEDDIRLLAALIYCESGNQSYAGKVAVGSVVINRMESKHFPDTLRDVIYQSGQFDPVWSGALDTLCRSGKEIKADCVKAAKEVLNEGSKLKGYYYFNIYYGRYKIGDHYFS